MSAQTTIQKLEDVVIKFAGDSGDGMQLTGMQFTNNTALLGIDLSTFPDFPAEIRAPQGTLARREWLSAAFFLSSGVHAWRQLRCAGGHECRRPES
ncbi:hypothetical protein [Thermoflavifilum sp.]|uniref:hypothetical protein n=1 Tax=Thermoflavifilum sp. TaxID=1968839 RepID=UPI0025D09D4C|nr:hypothetical protein [Thermoflavifilum sp.]